MNVRNCRGCGRIFNYVAGPMMCQVCREGLEAKFQEVKEYVRDVSPAQIRQWLREERLEVTEDSPIFLNCEGCGASIRSGKYCPKCTNTMASGFKKVINTHNAQKEAEKPKKKTDPKDNPRMRYL